MTTMRWSDHFSLVRKRQVGQCGGKSLPADELTWQGWFEGQLLCVISTVRLMAGNLAHFIVPSVARLGIYTLRGGYYVDLRVVSKVHLSRDTLMRLGQLARSEDDRAIYVRRDGESLASALTIPPAS